MRRGRKIIIALLIVLLLSAGAAFLARDWLTRQIFKPTDTSLPAGVERIDEGEDIEIIAENLDIPWEIAFLPDGTKLVTERPGTLKRIGGNNQTYNISGVRHVGEGGLMGLAVDPDFPDNNFIYLYMTTAEGGGLTNRVERYTYRNDNLSARRVIIENIPGANIHDGGRIAFGPDGRLYITTGDAASPNLSQDRNSLAGKILRLNPDGSIPDDNPFNTEVYTWGHRNPQGLAWDDQDRLWATEHGPIGFDELNLIKKGENYGWPLVTGDETRDGLTAPIIHSGRGETWAPAGLAHLDGTLFFAGLRGESLYEAEIGEGREPSLTRHLTGEFGRLRAAVAGPDGHIYITTSNRDGRGETRESDDKIIRINPGALKR